MQSIEIIKQTAPVYSLVLENDNHYFVGNANVLAAGTCNLKTIYSLISDVNKRINFKALINKIEQAGGNYSGFIDNIAKNGFTEQQIARLNDALNNFNATDLKKIVDEFASGDVTYQNLFKSEKATDAWNVLNIAAYNGRRKTSEVLERAVNVLSKEHISRSDLRAIIETNTELGGKATELAAFLDDLDHFALYKKTNNGFDQIITQLKTKWYGKADGANWVLDALKKEGITVFPPNSTAFEVSVTGLGRTYDAVVENAVTIGGIPKRRYYEFKSWGTVPPSKFAEQFIKDLNNTDITDLSQLKWYFDKAKKPPNFEINMKAAIDGLDKTKITDATLAKFKVANADDLLDKIEGSFSDIFYLK